MHAILVHLFVSAAAEQGGGDLEAAAAADVVGAIHFMAAHGARADFSDLAKLNPSGMMQVHMQNLHEAVT